MTSYRFSPALVVRALAALLLLAGLLVAIAAVLVGAFGVPSAVLSAAVVATVLVAVAVGLASTRPVASRLAVVRLDAAGYRIGLLRSAGVRRARWADVEDVVTATLSGHECAVFRLRDGRATTVPVDVLDVAAQVFLADVQARLDAAHGYRRLPRR